VAEVDKLEEVAKVAKVDKVEEKTKMVDAAKSFQQFKKTKVQRILSSMCLNYLSNQMIKLNTARQ